MRASIVVGLLLLALLCAVAGLVGGCGNSAITGASTQPALTQPSAGPTAAIAQAVNNEIGIGLSAAVPFASKYAVAFANIEAQLASAQISGDKAAIAAAKQAQAAMEQQASAEAKQLGQSVAQQSVSNILAAILSQFKLAPAAQ